MKRATKYWKKLPSIVRKPLVTIVGTAIILAGIIMLVAPGPGLAAIILGFAVLATEFPWAKKALVWSRLRSKQAYEYVKTKLFRSKSK